MLIQEALKKTGKAKRFGFGWFVEECRNEEYSYRVVNVTTNGVMGYELNIEHTLADDWKPFHKKAEEIRPECMGEIWQYTDKCGEGQEMIVTLFKWRPEGGKLRIQYVDHTDAMIFGTLIWHKEIIHNKNGWERLFPKVEDESVVIVEFEIPKEG
jgi:hypothetical protein